MAEARVCAGDCGRMVRPRRSTGEQFPGMLTQTARGMCSRCYVIWRESSTSVRVVSFVRYFPQGDTFGHEIVRGEVVGSDSRSWEVSIPLVGVRRLERAVWSLTMEDDDDGAVVVSLSARTDIDHAAVDQAVRGVRVRLTVREREAAVRILAGRQRSDGEIAQILGLDKKSAQKIRTRIGVPAAVGADGFPVAS